MPASPETLPDALVVLLPEAPGALWRWWALGEGGTMSGRAMEAGDHTPGTMPSWPEGAGQVLALVPAALAPVAQRTAPDLPPAQAIAAERLAETSADVHIAAAVHDGTLLTARADPEDIAHWLALLGEAGLDEALLVPGALALPRPEAGTLAGTVAGTLGGMALARTGSAAFAGEPELLAALAEEPVRWLNEAEIEAGLAALAAAPPLDLRQGRFAPRPRPWLARAEWRRLGWLTALAALLVLALVGVRIVRLNLDADARENAALAAAQKRYPAASDLALATSLADVELARRDSGGAGMGGFAPRVALVLAALQAQPGTTRLTELAYAPEGALRLAVATASPADLAALAAALRRDGWAVDGLPPADAGAAAVASATLTVRLP